MGYNQIKSFELEELKTITYVLADDNLIEDLMNRMKLEDHKDINVDTETPDDLNQEILKCLSACNLISKKKDLVFIISDKRIKGNSL